MKILKTPDTNWTYKHTCANCTAELEVEKTDVKFYSYPGDQRESGYETWTANCPICKVDFTIPLNSIPKAVQVEIKSGSLRAASYGGGWNDR